MTVLVNFSLLRRNRNFTLLYIGQFVSFFGTMITNVALPYQVYTETRSLVLVGLLSLVQLLPVLVTALVGGVLADRYQRRKLLLIAEFILAAGTLLLALNAHQAVPHIWPIFLIAAIMAAFNGLHRPALTSIAQQIVAKKDYPTMGSLSAFKYSIGMIVGPAIGGLLMAHHGMTFTYLVDAATFIISLIALFCLRDIPKPTAKKDESTFASIKEGVKYAWSRQELMGSYSVDFIAMIFGMPIALFPAIAMKFGGAKVVGMLYSAPAVGALFISFFSGWAEKVHYHGRAIAYSAIIWGVAIIGFGFTPNFGFALFFLMIAGGADAVSGIFRGVLWNQTIPTNLRGRLAGIEMISYLSGPKLGDTEASLVAAAFGLTASIVSGGVLCVLGVTVACYKLPKFWNYHSEKEIEIKS